MAAVIGLEAAIVTEVCQEAALSTGSVVVPANFNGAGQVVISGTSDAVTAAGDLAKAKGARKVIFLPVSGGFHSPLMKPAAEEMSVYFEDSGITDAKLPVVANVTAEYETDADVIRQNLAAQVAGAIRWEESMNRFLSDGFDFFIEIGSGSVLSSLIKRMSKDVRVYSVFDAAGVEAVKAALGVS
jgi:[acyl-carrier-protein] S-malonyltransferase